MAGCGTTLSKSITTASLKTTEVTASASNELAPTYTGTPVALYTLIARGANSCWLGPGRPLYQTHLFRARVSSKAKAAAPSIVIYERDKSTKPEKRSAALRINISAISSSQSTVDVINRRFSLPAAQLMRADVQRWARGKLQCGDNTPQAPAVETAITGNKT